MRALTYDEREESWASSRGMVLRDVPRPVLDPQRDPKDAERVIAKVKLAGFCGTDRGLWARKALGDMVQDSMKSRGEPVRIFGHECLAEIVEMGPAIAASGKFKIGRWSPRSRTWSAVAATNASGGNITSAPMNKSSVSPSMDVSQTT
jgi:threonine 3-dehydrogenase